MFCHVVSTWRVDWVPLAKGVFFFCGSLSVITLIGCCFLAKFDLFLRFGGSSRMSHCNCFDQLKIPTISALSLKPSEENFTLEWFHYFQLLSITKISIFISTTEVLRTDVTQ